MNLDDAVAQFKNFQTGDTASDLVKTALEYWNDAIIGDLTLAAHLSDVAAWLRND